MVMKDAAFTFESADGGPGSRQATAPPEAAHNVTFSENEGVGSKLAAPYDHKATIVVASIWLALYVIMAISFVISPTGQNQPAPLTAQARNGSVSTD
jgi:hypothetical protein